MLEEARPRPRARIAANPVDAGRLSVMGSLHFPAGEPLPDDLVRSLVEAKLEILRR